MTLQNIIAGVLACLVASANRAEATYALKLHLHNVVPSKGQLLLAVCTAEQFLMADCLYRTVVPATVDPQLVIVPRGRLSAGRYAVQVFYDRNSNARLDRNLLGIPSEPVGFSRDASGRMGPPQFGQAAFDYDGTPQDLTIHLY